MNQLHDACEIGDVEEVTYLLSNEECDINSLNIYGESPLHVACGCGHLEVVKVLLKFQKCDINARNSHGESPLHVACGYGHLEVVKVLLKFQECDINARNSHGESPLHIACGCDHLEVVKVLLKFQKCEINIQNSYRNTPLHKACYRSLFDIIKFLLEMRCSTNILNYEGETAQDIQLSEDGDFLLHIACWWDDLDIVKYLIINEKCNPNVQNIYLEDTPLHIACYKKSLSIIRFLLDRRCNTNIPNMSSMTAQDIPLNDDGDYLLHIACKWDHVDIVRYLLIKERCNPNVQNIYLNTPLHIACHMKSLSIIRLLLERRCSTNIPNKKGETAQDIPLNGDGDGLLHIACRWDDVNIVQYLIANERCDPNVLSSTSKNTPLHIGTKYGQDDIIVQLLSYKECNSNAQNSEWDTPLHVACCKKSLNIIKSLLQTRCDTNVLNKKGETAQNIPLNDDGDYLLHIACQLGDVNIVRYLITNERCDPSVQSSTSKNTPLHIAAKYGRKNTIVQLLSYKRCKPNAQNKEGDTPLHFAAEYGQEEIIVELLHKECDPNAQNKKGETPLHFAAKYGQNGTIVKLLSYKECDPDVQNRQGDIPLHFAVRHSETVAISQLLDHHQSNLNAQNKEGNTPLHIACCMKLLHIIMLLLERKCSTNIPNKKGETAQDIPLNEDGDCLLHIACQLGDVGIVRYLLTDERCNPNVQCSTSGNTPLHIATKDGKDDIMAQLLSYKKCDPNVLNKEGDTPLHVAVRKNITPSISQLLSKKQCNPNVLNKNGDAPLHVAVRKSITPAISQLLSNKQCNPNVQNKDGDTPLHIAVRDNITPVISRLLQYNPNIQNNVSSTLQHIAARKNTLPGVSQLLANKQCNPNVVNNDHLTPLLIAVQHNNSSLATALLQHDRCDPTLCDQHGNTPLHLACIGGETQPEMVGVAKQLLMSVDPSCVNNAGQTPIELTTSYQLIQAISHIVKCKTKQSVQTYINMFIVGNPETGKSTLVKAICKEANILWKIVPKQMRRVKNVPLHTAGIIPTTFQSKAFGNTILYDLAGHVEYYTSHAAVIQSTVISTPPAFIVVINLSNSEEKISQTLRYWWSFIDNHAARSSAPPQVILVGSHADIVKSTGGNVQEKMTDISALLKKLPASFHFAGQVALDCRDPASRKLQHLCYLVNQSCTVLRQTADVDLRCHVLYAFLLDRFKDKVACTVSDVATSIKETSALLPQKPDTLIPLISTLSDKGLLLLVKGGESHGGWWIILQKQALLGEMNGVIFAPKSFRQHKDLSWSTGVVPFFKLKNEFPNYNPNMVSKFLTHLEFCFKIEDHQTLALLKDEAATMEDTCPDVSEEYYFFPALVNIENPLHVWEQNDRMSCKCGWFYQCIRPDQFLTTQFLHVLILRLAFTFALKLDPGDCCEDSLTLRRKCSVWKHGIAWLDGAPTETVVEVGLQLQSVVVIMRCPEGKEAECAQLRSKVIQKVLEAKDEHCKAVQMSESLFHPTDAKYPFTDHIEDVKLYSLSAIARSTVSEEEALDHRGRNPIPVQDLLLFHPYSSDTSTELLSELFGRKHSMDEKMRRQVLETLNKDTLKPRFADSERRTIMKQFDPVTLHIQQTDKTTLKAVQLFTRQVVLILHTCNLNEYWAAVERLEPPTKEDGSNIRDRTIIYPQIGSVIGWFAGYRAAVVRTGQGNKCRDELTTALTKSFPNGKAVIGAGIAYASKRECNFADVLISDQIEKFVQYKIVDGEITNRGPREQIDPNVQRVFENPARDWTDMKCFACTDDNQTSVAHIGCIVSAPTLVQDELLRDQLMKHTPDCIGGEMEGWVLLELKRTLKGQHNKDIEVIVIKGVADYGDLSKGDEWQWTAAKAAVDCIHYCLEKSGGIEFGAKPQPTAIQDLEPEATCNTPPLSTKPTLPELLKFTCTDGRVLNIPVEIETKYVKLSAFLLDDSTGSRVKIMAHKYHYDAERINTEIVHEWLTGKGKQPVNWKTLVEVLRDIELSALANEIEAVKCPQDQSQET